MKVLRFKAVDAQKVLSKYFTYNIFAVNGTKTFGEYAGICAGDIEEYLLDMGDIKEGDVLEAVVDGFSREGEDLFIKSFMRHAPSSYNFYADAADSDTPLCMPWLWFISLEEPYWLSCADNPTDCGKNWAEYCKVYSYFEVGEE